MRERKVGERCGDEGGGREVGERCGDGEGGRWVRGVVMGREGGG